MQQIDSRLLSGVNTFRGEMCSHVVLSYPVLSYPVLSSPVLVSWVGWNRTCRITGQLAHANDDHIVYYAHPVVVAVAHIDQIRLFVRSN